MYDILGYVFFYGFNKKYSYKSIEELLSRSEFIHSLENDKGSKYLYNHNLDEIITDVYKEKVDIDITGQVNSISLWLAETYIRLFYRYHKTFYYLFLIIGIEEMINLYSVYHEMDYSKIESLFYERQRYYKLLDLLLRQKDISIRQLSVLTGINENTLYNYSRDDNNLYNAKFSNIKNIADVLDVDINVFLESINNYEEYEIFELDKEDEVFYAYLALYYLEYYFKIGINDYQYNVMKNIFVSKTSKICFEFIKNDKPLCYIEPTDKENKKIIEITLTLKEKLGKIENINLVIYENNQTSNDVKTYKHLVSLGYENIFIINQERIMRVSNDKCQQYDISYFVYNSLSGRARKEANLEIDALLE